MKKSLVGILCLVAVAWSDGGFKKDMQACNDKGAATCFSMAKEYGNDYPSKARVFYYKACKESYHMACKNLAITFKNQKKKYTINGVDSKDRRLCSMYGGSVCYDFGVMHASGSGAKQDQKVATSFFNEACDAGNMEGCRALGTAYAKGRGVARDISKAKALYTKACQGGNRLACGLLRRLPRH